MKLLGVTNGKQVLTSVAHYDCRIVGGEGDDYIMMDGGVLGINCAGYNRRWGTVVWFEVPQTMADLYNDWKKSHPRKYGIWNIEDVKILSPEEYPDTTSFEWRANNQIWGTNGLSGKEPTRYVLLKECTKDHLDKISDLCQQRGNKELQEIADYWRNK